MLYYLKQIKKVRDILPTLMTVLTRHDRYLPDIEWSEDSWTHNIFRLYEMLFWRRVGIKAEISSYAKVKKGKVVEVTYACHSIESVFALTEQYIREVICSWKLKPFRIYIPQIIMPQGFAVPTSPYLFAIAFDSASQAAWVASGTSVTYSHTCTGSNLIIVPGGYINSNGGLDTTTGWTYNGVACTRSAFGAAYNATDVWYVYNLVAPATGANNVVMSQTLSFNCELFALSFSGAAQTGQLDSAAVQAGSASQGSPFSMTTTVVAANSMLIGGGRTDGTPSASTNTTLAFNGFSFIAYSTATVGTGSQSLVVTGTSGRMFGSFSGSVAPAVAAGPANLKTYNTNPKANIKTIDTNVIANVKSLNTNV